MKFKSLHVFAAASLALSAATYAHGPIHGQIEEVTKRIERDPRNPALYLKRAELHRIHSDWREALADYRKIRRLDPGLDVVDFLEGRMLLEANSLEAAKHFLERFVSRHRDDPEALWVLARVEAKLGRADRAAEAYTRALARLSQPKPEHFLERSRALAAAGRTDQALAGIDAGIQRLGPLVTLEMDAIDFELHFKRYDAALARLARIQEQTPRKERWLARRGEILAQAGRGEEARDAFVQALQAIDALPAHLRVTRAMQELEQQCKASLAGERAVRDGAARPR
jgi:predicted Zn-dependent protease